MKLPRPYEYFDETIEAIKSGKIENKRIGGGSESNVYLASINDEDFAIKFAIAWSRLGRPRKTDAATQRKIDAGICGLNVTGLEQIQSGSIEKGVAVYDFVSGQTVGSMNETDIEQITEAHMADFFATVDTAVELGIEFDPWNQDGSNVIYSPESGFTLIDYFVDYTKTSKDENRLNGYKSLGSKAVELARLFGTSNYDFQMEWSRIEDFKI